MSKSTSFIKSRTINLSLLPHGQETAQRRIMLAQLVTDEAKPGSGEKWFADIVFLFLFFFSNSDLVISRLRTYTFVVYSSQRLICEIYPAAGTSSPHWGLT
jgi:hypothetical protein